MDGLRGKKPTNSEQEDALSPFGGNLMDMMWEFPKSFCGCHARPFIP